MGTGALAPGVPIRVDFAGWGGRPVRPSEARQRYNAGVSANRNKPRGASDARAQRLETVGLIVILLLILALIITRSFHHISWRAR